MRSLLLFVALLFAALSGAQAQSSEAQKPTLFLIGDSTVKNGTKGQVGWGQVIGKHFDDLKIHIANHALGGRSSRSYLREGLWDKVAAAIKPGDFVIMQFGHNDNGPLDAQKARASIKGNSDEEKEVTIKETGAKETVRSFGWYMRKYAGDAKAKGATPIVCSLVPRNIWVAEKVSRSTDSFVKWAQEAARQTGAQFVDLNQIVANRYDAEGQQKVAAEYFTSADHTHTNRAGAEVNAACVVEGIRRLPDCPLKSFLRPNVPAEPAK